MGLFDDMFGSVLNSDNLDSSLYLQQTEILLRKDEFEKNLDDMWAAYSRGLAMQIVNYQKQVDRIKGCGLKVLRNSEGKHKILMK